LFEFLARFYLYNAKLTRKFKRLKKIVLQKEISQPVKPKNYFREFDFETSNDAKKNLGK
jgi:hypothetical protein